MPESINSKIKEQYDHDDSGGSLDTNLGDFLDSQGASGTSNNTKWRNWAEGTGTSLNTRLFNKHGGSGSFNTRWKNWIAFGSTHSFSFDGSNDYLYNESPTGLPSGDTFTISAWIKVNASHDYASHHFPIFRRDEATNNLAFIISNGTPKIGLIRYGAETKKGNTTISDDTWHHVAVSVNNLEATFYLNGFADGTQTFSGSFVHENEFNIGMFSNGNNIADGNIDEVAVWNTALSSSDITSVYNNGKIVDLSKSASYGTDRTANLKLWLRCGSKVLPESDASIARSDFYTDFDGTDDYVDCGEGVGNELGNDYSGDLTVSAWIKPLSTSGDKGFLNIGDFSSSYGEFVFHLYSNQLYLTLNSNGWRTFTAFTNTDWSHVTAVYKAGSESDTKIYVNGESQSLTGSGTFPSASDMDFNGLKTIIGAYHSTTYAYDGKISNLGIYQTALDAQTIKQFAKSRYTPMRDNRFSVVDFDGTNDYIDLPMTFSYTNHSVIAWVYIEDDSTGKTIFEAMDSATDGIQIIAQSNESIRTRINTNSSDYSSTIYSNQWVHIAHTYDGSHRRLYINGERVINSATTQTIDTTTNARIGARSYTNPSSYFKGSMSSVSLYTAGKTEQEVYALYQKGITYNESSESDLFAYYKMGDDTSKAFPTIADSSSNSNDGTITNGESADIVQQMVAGYDMGAFESTDLSDTFPAIIDVNEPVLGVEMFPTSNSLYTTDGSHYTKDSANPPNLTYQDTGTGTVTINNSDLGETIVGAGICKLTITISGLTSGQANFKAVSTNFANIYIDETMLDNGTHTFYFTRPTGGGNGFLFRSDTASGSTFTISDYSLKKLSGNVGTMTNQDSADLVYSSVLPDQSFLTGVNSAYNFIDLDGSDEFISVSDSSSLQITGDMTISAWINPTGITSNRPIIFKRDAGGTNYQLYLSGDSTPKLKFYDGSADTVSSDSLTKDQWQHIAITFDSGATDGSTFYINGVASGTTTLTISGDDANLLIGKNSVNNTCYEGKIGQVAVHNKTLSATEISAINTAGRHTNLLDSYSDNLVGYWAMGALDAKTGLSDVGDGTIYDRSGNSNHGTATNTESADLKSSPNAEPNGYAKGDTNRSTTTP